MSCQMKSPDLGGALWRARVERLARESRLRDSGLREDFILRACDVCRIANYVNQRIYADIEPFSCGDSLYDPDAVGRRDGYWYACALRGIDPEARWGEPLRLWRRWQLMAACLAVGLRYGSVRRCA